MNALRGLAGLLIFQCLGEAVSHVLKLPVPGPVVGMLLLFGALFHPAVRGPVAACADFLLAHLSLLFVPVGVGVVRYGGLLHSYGLRLAAAIIVSTWAGMAVTAWVLRASRPAGEEPAPHA
jgi:holin-like protein